MRVDFYPPIDVVFFAHYRFSVQHFHPECSIRTCLPRIGGLYGKLILTFDLPVVVPAFVHDYNPKHNKLILCSAGSVFADRGFQNFDL